MRVQLFVTAQITNLVCFARIKSALTATVGEKTSPLGVSVSS